MLWRAHSLHDANAVQQNRRSCAFVGIGDLVVPIHVTIDGLGALKQTAHIIPATANKHHK